MQNIVIVGNGVSANLMYGYIRHDSRFKVCAFAADPEYIESTELFEIPVVDLNNLSSAYPANQFQIVLAIGYGNLNRNRESLFHRVTSMGFTVVTYIHPDAKVFSQEIGTGAIIMPNAFVDVYSRIGDNSVVWGNCSVAHHASIGMHCWLATGSIVSAHAVIGDNSFLGIGATVSNNVLLGSHNVLGAQVLVTRRTSDYEVYIQKPTEKFRLSSEQYLRIAQL